MLSSHKINIRFMKKKENKSSWKYADITLNNKMTAKTHRSFMHSGIHNTQKTNSYFTLFFFFFRRLRCQCYVHSHFHPHTQVVSLPLFIYTLINSRTIHTNQPSHCLVSPFLLHFQVSAIRSHTLIIPNLNHSLN